MITCEPSASVIVAPARSAMERITSVPAALSPVATTAQAGKAFQAGGPDGSETPTPRPGAGSRRCARQEVGGERVVKLRGVNRELDGRLPAVSNRILERD